MADSLGPFPKSPVSPLRPRIMEIGPSKGLAAGYKRIGGRGGFTRLGNRTRRELGEARHGRPIVSHRY